MTISQDNRLLKIQLAGSAKDAVILTALQAEEHISKSYAFRLEILSDDVDIDAKTVVGKDCSVSVGLADDKTRPFHGVVWRFGPSELVMGLEDAAPLRMYHAEVVPWLKLLALNSDSRIFQEMTVPEIVEQIFKDAGHTDYKLKLRGTYSKVEYCVQYRETDYDFVTRLMRDAGIYYYFVHDDSKHLMVLADDATGYTAGANIEFTTGEDKDAILWWQRSYQLSPASVTNWGYDFENPTKNLEAKEKSKLKVGVYAKGESYDYPDISQTHTYDISKSNAKARMEAYEAQAHVVEGKSNAAALATGAKFKLTEHPVDSETGQEYAIVSMIHAATDPYVVVASRNPMDAGPDDESSYQNYFECVPSKVPYRPMWTLPRPRIAGPHTAQVTGPSGNEIHTDKYGRVKVQFHWDREGKQDEKSSCWIRVAQPWAGNKYGAYFLPRVGDEVLVEFVDGDLNRPIVTGSVHNKDSMPPFDPLNKGTLFGIKTKSLDKGKAKNFTELSFNDKIGNELVYFHAERDFERIVENNDKLKVGFDHKDAGDQTIDIYNNRTVTIDKGNDTLTIKTGNQKISIDKGDHSLTITQGNHEIAIKAGKSDIEAAKSITLKVGPSFIKIEPTKITMKSLMIQAKADLEALVSGTMVGVKGKAMVAIKGGMVKIN